MTNPPTSEIGDRELVSRAQAGELDAFETLTTRYEQRVFSLAMRMLRQEQDAEDVTQQTFLSALENLNGFRGEASFATWLFRIATHAALKVIRKHKGLKTVSLEEATEGADRADSVPASGIHRRLAAVPGTTGAKTRNPAVAGRGAGPAGRKTPARLSPARRGRAVREGNRRGLGVE